jgi:hypothetical protein
MLAYSADCNIIALHVELIALNEGRSGGVEFDSVSFLSSSISLYSFPKISD